MLDLVKPSKTHDLTTLARLKTELFIQGSDEDTLLAAAITEVSAFVSRYCQRSFPLESLIEVFEIGNVPETFVLLKKWPVRQVFAVRLGASLADPEKAYWMDCEEGTMTRIRAGRETYFGAYTTVAVSYAGGYPLDAIPEALQLAVCRLVKILRTRGQLAACEDDGTLDFGFGRGRLPPDCFSLLEPFRDNRLR